MTPSNVAGEFATLVAVGPPTVSYEHGVSLLHGWLPAAVQGVAVVLLLAGIGRRSRRWLAIWLPVAALIGIATVAVVHWFVNFQGMGDNPALPVFWAWVGLAAAAACVAVLGWRATPRWRRAVSVLALLTCLLTCAVTLNLSVGYFPTVQMAWNQLTAGSLPDEVPQETVKAMARSHTVPAHGTVVAVVVPNDAWRTRHRKEYVYLPPAWYSTSPPPQLPTVMMIGGQFNTPADWIRQGDAVTTVDRFAGAHGGNAPVLVFVDTGGSFNNDTECVNGPRGNAADHLTRDLPSFMQTRFGVSPRGANWGIVGFSMGGTCAVDLTVMHPELFSSFVDIGGDRRPTAGTREQTIARLFGGNAAAFEAFDPGTVISRHGAYRGISGWFAVSAPTSADGTSTPPGAEAQAARTLCALGKARGITCTVTAFTGKHNWPFAADTFTVALPWLAGQISTPAVGREPLPRQTFEDAAHSVATGKR
jgi:S-formylglutathione hydrolase FrmB